MTKKQKHLTLEDRIDIQTGISQQETFRSIAEPAFILCVGEFNKTEYNNFVNTTVMSIATTITQTLTRDLLLSSNRYFKLNPRSLFSYNITELSAVAQQMTNSTAMRRNEWRDWLGMAPDSEMEELIVLENYIPQEKIGDQNKLKGGEEENAEAE